MCEQVENSQVRGAPEKAPTSTLTIGMGLVPCQTYDSGKSPSLIGAFSRMVITKEAFTHLRVCVPDIGKRSLGGWLRDLTQEGIEPNPGWLHSIIAGFTFAGAALQAVKIILARRNPPGLPAGQHQIGPIVFDANENAAQHAMYPLLLPNATETFILGLSDAYGMPHLIVNHSPARFRIDISDVALNLAAADPALAVHLSVAAPVVAERQRQRENNHRVRSMIVHHKDALPHVQFDQPELGKYSFRQLHFCTFIYPRLRHAVQLWPSMAFQHYQDHFAVQDMDKPFIEVVLPWPLVCELIAFMVRKPHDQAQLDVLTIKCKNLLRNVAVCPDQRAQWETVAPFVAFYYTANPIFQKLSMAAVDEYVPLSSRYFSERIICWVYIKTKQAGSKYARHIFMVSLDLLLAYGLYHAVKVGYKRVGGQIKW